MIPATIYQSSKGPKMIADLPYPYLVNAHDKLVREQPHRQAEIIAMKARIEAEAVDDANPRAVIGDNDPPAPVEATAAPTDPFEAHRVHIDDLYMEAKNWADGTEIKTEAEAEQVNRLIDDFKAAVKAAEASRDEEKKPYQEKVTEIQERYYPLVFDGKTAPKGLAVRALAALLAVKTVWGNKVEADRKAAAALAAKEAADLAANAIQASREAVGDIAATESAETLLAQAKRAIREAAQLTRPVVGSGMLTVWETEIADPILAARWAWANHEAECKEFFLTLARRDVQAGVRTLAGFTVTETRKAVR